MTSATPPVRPSTSGSRLLQLAARFPLATFLILGFSLGYALAFLWGLAYRGVIPGGGLAAALHIAPDELTGGASGAVAVSGRAVRDLGGQRPRRGAEPLPPGLPLAGKSRLVADGPARAASPHRGFGPADGRPAPLRRRPLIPRQPADASAGQLHCHQPLGRGRLDRAVPDPAGGTPQLAHRRLPDCDTVRSDSPAVAVLPRRNR